MGLSSLQLWHPLGDSINNPLSIPKDSHIGRCWIPKGKIEL